MPPITKFPPNHARYLDKGGLALMHSRNDHLHVLRAVLGVLSLEMEI